MENTDMMKLELTRHEVCKVSLALTNLICGMISELENENISDNRKAVLTSSIEMWETLRSKIRNQLKAQDI